MKSSKLFSIAIITAIISAVLGALSCDSGGGWAVKIDSDTISIDEFNNYYYAFNKTTYNLKSNEDVDKLAAEVDTLDPRDPRRQYLLKSNFIDHLVAQRLLYNKAVNDSSIDKKELNTTIELAKMQTVATYYLGKKLKDKITVTDAEVEKFYTENRSDFRGVPLNDEFINRIKQQLVFQKSSVASNEYIMELMAESKVNKEGFKNYIQSAGKTESKTEDKGQQEPAAQEQAAP
jgi:hypothetical protein